MELNENEILEEIEELKQIVLELKIQMRESYHILKEEIFLLCDDVKDNIYLSQNDFELMLDLLLNYAMYVDIKNEFDSLIKAYFTLYPDSVENYIGYYNEMLEES